MSLRRPRLTLTAIASVAVLIVAPVIYAFAQEPPGRIKMPMAEQHAAAAAGSQFLQHGLAMDEEVKLRLDEIDNRISAAEKRFDDVKCYLTIVSSVFGVIFSVVSLVESK